jgi:hypothetical protein
MGFLDVIIDRGLRLTMRVRIGEDFYKFEFSLIYELRGRKLLTDGNASSFDTYVNLANGFYGPYQCLVTGHDAKLY